MDNDQDVCTPMLLSSAQTNSLIKVLLDRVNTLEYELFEKQKEVDKISSANLFNAEMVSNWEMRYNELQEQFWGLKNTIDHSKLPELETLDLYGTQKSVPPPLPKVIISEF